jgi:hypothetical protein
VENKGRRVTNVVNQCMLKLEVRVNRKGRLEKSVRAGYFCDASITLRDGHFRAGERGGESDKWITIEQGVEARREDQGRMA